MLAHIVYKSRCRTGTSLRELEALRERFAHNNRAHDITGVLLCDGVYFLQVRPDKRYRLAVASFKEDTHNHVEIIQRESAHTTPLLHTNQAHSSDSSTQQQQSQAMQRATAGAAAMAAIKTGVAGQQLQLEYDPWASSRGGHGSSSSSSSSS